MRAEGSGSPPSRGRAEFKPLLHLDDVGDRHLPVLHGLQDDELAGLIVVVEVTCLPMMVRISCLHGVTHLGGIGAAGILDRLRDDPDAVVAAPGLQAAARTCASP